MIRTSLVVVAFLGWSTVAAAQEAGAPAPAPSPVQPMPPPENRVLATPTPTPTPAIEAKPRIPKITVMWAPILVFLPLVEFTAEYRVMDKLGVSVTLGAGKRTIEDSSGTTAASGPEYEVGAQVRYYAIGNFRHGMEVGVQALEEYVKFDEPIAPGLIVAAGGFTVGGFVGYKIATRVGFTFEAQLGARYLVVEPAFQGASGGPMDVPDKWVPLAHLNVGWSF